jgi:hypothetical protein
MAVSAWCPVQGVRAFRMPGYGDVCGAITVVRCGTQPPLGFRELGILSQIGELTGAAAGRLRGHGGEPLAG